MLPLLDSSPSGVHNSNLVRSLGPCGFGVRTCEIGCRTKVSSDPKSKIPIQNQYGGKGGIRTHGTLLRFTAFPVLPVQPLLHLSVKIRQPANGTRQSGRVLPTAFRQTAYRTVAERVGFEPTVPVRVQQFSRLPDSTTLAPLRESSIINAGCRKYQVRFEDWLSSLFSSRRRRKNS